MKNLFFLFLSISLSISACKTSQNTLDQTSSSSQNQIIQIHLPANLKTGQQLQVELTTTLDEGVMIHDPMRIRIERWEHNEWKALHILYCPCGANCDAPPREQHLAKNQIWTMSWNLTESWCEKVKGQDIPNTIKSPSMPGKYRFVLYYSINTPEKINITKEFQIIH